MTALLREIDLEKFSKNIFSSLRADEFYEKCHTNFREILIETLIDTIAEDLEKDEWCLQSFNKDKSEKLFNSFMENSEITVGLHKRVDGSDYTFKEITVEFNFSIEEKKKIAEFYLDKIINYKNHLKDCIIGDFEEKDIDIISEFLSEKVYQILSTDEIKAKFGQKLEKIISDN